ncbi:hypothetical protein THFILI_00540 [Thermus filiformis]|uniref:SCP domain-containing protein n=1 Tax=Thermus filiformis TaxID=276 RepID=A0A0A2WR50_THEFI|nr:hypothetical protein THFILI_00540 [Thermus filiformis]
MHRALPGESLTLTVQLKEAQTEPVTVRLQLADPCAKGTANCPGWDSSRYPYVDHSGGPYTLSQAGESGTFTFSVSPDAIPQGPYKYEVVVERGDKTWVHPFYLRIPLGERSAIEALNMWRSLADLPPVREDPEWAFKAWLHGRYRVYNYPNVPPHDEYLDQPFATPEGREAGQRGNEYIFIQKSNGQPVFKNDEEPISWWIAAPFHRFPLIYSALQMASAGTYREVKDYMSYPGYGWSSSTLPAIYSQDSPSHEILFPPPAKTIPLNRFMYGENPSPISVCMNPDQAQKRPFLTQEGLVWGKYDYGYPPYVPSSSPLGFPITVATYVRGDTEVLEARLVRLSDGAVNPICAYGSLQYWEEREFWRDRAINGLRAYGALVVIPHEVLTPGEEYEVYIRATIAGQSREWTWRFRVAPQDQLVPLRLAPARWEGWEEGP